MSHAYILVCSIKRWCCLKIRFGKERASGIGALYLNWTGVVTYVSAPLDLLHDIIHNVTDKLRFVAL